MYTIFMNSENSKTSKPYVLILKLTNKFDLRFIKCLCLLHMEKHKKLIQ